MRLPFYCFPVLLLLLLGLPLGNAVGQTQGTCTIHGYLEDSLTQEPWIGLTVNVAGTGLGALTDDHGSFTITLPQHPQNEQITLIVRGIEMPEIRLYTKCPLNSNLLEQRFTIADRTPKKEDYHVGPPGNHGSKIRLPDYHLGPYPISAVSRPSGTYFVDREGITWRIAY